MRPINLIPIEERHGQHAPLRSGSLLYILIGGLVVVLAAVTALVLTNNQIADHKSEIAQLEQEDAAASERALQLSSYTQFRDLREQRVATVQSLADSRFDWERVMRELALILPGNVWLLDLSATASSEQTGGGSSLRGAVIGPALEMTGCAEGQEAVAGFVTALKDIDGVTRVGLESSQVTGEEGGAGATGGCTGNTISVTVIVAFDAAPLPASATSEVAPAPIAEPTSSESSEEG